MSYQKLCSENGFFFGPLEELEPFYTKKLEPKKKEEKMTSPASFFLFNESEPYQRGLTSAQMIT
jgi:hypothetical protein